MSEHLHCSNYVCKKFAMKLRESVEQAWQNREMLSQPDIVSAVKTVIEEIDKGRVQLQTEVTETLNEYTSRIKERINDNFYNFDQHLLNEERKLAEMNSQSSQVQSSLNEIGTHMKVYI